MIWFILKTFHQFKFVSQNVLNYQNILIRFLFSLQWSFTTYIIYYAVNLVFTHFAENMKRNVLVLNMFLFVDASKKGNNWIILFPLT